MKEHGAGWAPEQMRRGSATTSTPMELKTSDEFRLDADHARARTSAVRRSRSVLLVDKSGAIELNGWKWPAGGSRRRRASTAAIASGRRAPPLTAKSRNDAPNRERPPARRKAAARRLVSAKKKVRAARRPSSAPILSDWPKRWPLSASRDAPPRCPTRIRRRFFVPFRWCRAFDAGEKSAPTLTSGVRYCRRPCLRLGETPTSTRIGQRLADLVRRGWSAAACSLLVRRLRVVRRHSRTTRRRPRRARGVAVTEMQASRDPCSTYSRALRVLVHRVELEALRCTPAIRGRRARCRPSRP